MITQLLGLRMATPTLWRFVLLFSSVASVVQLCLSRFIIETPVWLKRNGKSEDSHTVQRFLFQEPGDPRFHVAIPALLWTNIHFLGFAHSVEDPLLDETPEGFQHESDDRRESTSVSIPNLLTSLELRRPLIVVSFAMISQQLSGNKSTYSWFPSLIVGHRHQRK
jgi:hypothetical protein